MGLVIFGAMALYLVLAIFVVTAAIKHAGKNGKSVGRWGWGAALVMYLIPFWDWIPTVAMHQYYCATEAGFWVYKTPEQWKKENPGVMETLVNIKAPSKREGDDMNFTDTYFLNHRFSWIVKEHRASSMLHVLQRSEEVVDIGTNQVLARYVDFRSGYPNGLAGISPRNAGIAAAKFWLVSRHCSNGGSDQDSLQNIMKIFYGEAK
jgi:hypothetical protein